MESIPPDFISLVISDLPTLINKQYCLSFQQQKEKKEKKKKRKEKDNYNVLLIS